MQSAPWIFSAPFLIVFLVSSSDAINAISIRHTSMGNLVVDNTTNSLPAHYCNKSFDELGYRLGDLYYGFSTPSNAFNAEDHLRKFPGSIAAAYIIMDPTPMADEKTGLPLGHVTYPSLMRRIIDSEKYRDFAKPQPQEWVIHVRAGDVLWRCAANFWLGEQCKDTEMHRYLKTRKDFERLAKKLRMWEPTVITLVSGTHYGEGPGETQEYLGKIKQVFESVIPDVGVNIRLNMNADCDLIYMSNARHFIGTGGGFDDLIGEMVVLNGHRAIRNFQIPPPTWMQIMGISIVLVSLLLVGIALCCTVPICAWIVVGKHPP